MCIRDFPKLLVELRILWTKNLLVQQLVLLLRHVKGLDRRGSSWILSLISSMPAKRRMVVVLIRVFSITKSQKKC